MTGDAGGQITASFREKGHGIVVVMRIRVTHKSAVIFREDVIDAAIELVLVIRLDGGADIVVGAGRVGKRIVLQNLGGEGIDPACGDCVGGKGNAG